MSLLLAAMLLLCSLPVAFLFTPGMATCGSCNCPGCAICSDDFNRADSSDISTGSDCGWTEVAGSAWDITSNQLRCTTAGIAICNTAHPDGDSSMIAEVDFKHDTSGSACDVLVGYVDSDNYFYARYTVAGASGSIDIRKKLLGVHSSLALLSSVTMNTSTLYTAHVCVSDNGTITASLDGVVKKSAYFQTVTGTKAGLGATGSGTATFDTWVLTKSYHVASAASCEQCQPAAISACQNSTPENCCLHAPPDEIDVTIPSFLTNDECSNCAAVAGTYTCVRGASGRSFTSQSDHWAFEVLDFCSISGLPSPWTTAVSADLVINFVLGCSGSECGNNVYLTLVPIDGSGTPLPDYDNVGWLYFPAPLQDDCDTTVWTLECIFVQLNPHICDSPAFGSVPDAIAQAH